MAWRTRRRVASAKRQPQPKQRLIDDNTMSFRFFIYYCALVGGWTAFVGFFLGTSLAPENRLGQNGIKGMFLGLMIALGLSLVDALWNLSLRRITLVLLRVGVSVLVGAVAGLMGGMLGLWLYDKWAPLFVLAWTLTGLLVGASIGVFEMINSLVRQQDMSGARKKLVKCLIGGAAGGILGGILAMLLRVLLPGIFPGKEANWLWSPTAFGFVALGMCIGLLVGLAQVILKEAWIKVEAGFRPGREMILAKENTTIGRAEGCDIGLFGDSQIEKLHASIIQAGSRYYLEDPGTPGGTYINDRRVQGRVPLNSGDKIRLGKSVLCFRERQKRAAAPAT
jgi:hypothetical protein